MKKTNLSVAIALLATSAVSIAAEEDKSFYGFTPSASVALTTDYVWRGVSQSANAPAIQGSFDLSHESGAYIGIWGSNIKFDENIAAGEGASSLELDIYAGFSNEIDIAGTGVTYDLGWLRYEYPTAGGSISASNWNFNELYFGLAVSPIKNLNVSTYYYYGLKIEHALPGEYTDMALDYTLPDSFGGITLLAHAGYYNQKGGADNYWDWKIGGSKEFAGYTIEVAYTDTDDTGIGGQTDGSKVVATISREFGADSNGGLSLPDGFSTSASVALTTDYVWRGVSQTANAPAIQGSFDVSHESGAYIGVWGSNIKFDENIAAGEGASSLELDIYAGFSNEVDIAGTGVTYDIGWLRYEYPTADGSITASNWNFNELYFGLAISPVKDFNFSTYYYYGLKIEHALPGEYTDMSADYTLPDSIGGITILGHAGYYNQKGGADNYWDWKVGGAKDFGIFNVEVAYTDTDDSGAGNLDNAKAVATISTSF